jgi:hypothetical protein
VFVQQEYDYPTGLGGPIDIRYECNIDSSTTLKAVLWLIRDLQAGVVVGWPWLLVAWAARAGSSNQKVVSCRPQGGHDG